jgi:hypothetical protein
MAVWYQLKLKPVRTEFQIRKDLLEKSVDEIFYQYGSVENYKAKFMTEKQLEVFNSRYGSLIADYDIERIGKTSTIL